MKKILFFITALLLCGTMNAQDYHYTYDFHDYENNFPLTGEVYLNGERLTSPTIEIAAFVGEEVRGSEFLLEVDPDNYPGRYFVWLGISYTTAGETVTFRMYDHATGIEYTDCSTTTLTNADGYGEIWDPFNIYFTAEEPVSYGPEYPWVVQGGFENYLYLETQIQINGVPVTNTNWEVGAFCGDECRGFGDADNWWVSPVDNSNILEIVIGGETGDVINFYLYDVTNSEVFHGVCSLAIDWIDGDLGDMFEPLVLNFVTEQTFEKDILAYTPNTKDHYYLVASPIGEVSPENVTHMLENSYDLYYFDQTQEKEWINYKGDEALNNLGGFALEPGKGYLYANSENVTLTFTGFPYNGDGQVTLTKTSDANANFQGWNLVGNPFAQTAYITKSFYTMNTDGSELMAGEGNSVAAMEGIFVVAETDGETMSFSTEEPQSKNGALVLNVTRNRGAVIDRAIIRFGNENGLPKFQLNKDNTKVYIPQDANDYAVVSFDGDMGEMPVNFKAADNGTYTLVVNSAEVTFNYLHLIDNLKGIEVDLLANPSYTFDAQTTDYASRFKLVFVTGINNDDVFGFYNNGNWIINNDGDAILQVVDVNGRILSSEDIHGSCSKHIGAAPGVYMLRLITDKEMKVQKIVVR